MEYILDVFNTSFSLNYFSRLWKTAKDPVEDIMLPKSGKQSMYPKIYRSATLQPVIPMVVDRLLQKRILLLFDGYIRNRKFEFHKEHRHLFN